MRWIEWDCDQGRAVEYRRTGECSQCGDCCAAVITFQHGSVPEGETPLTYGGGLEAGPTGVWQEVEDDAGRRVLRRQIINPVGHGGCSQWQDGKCLIHAATLPAFCRYWPAAPSDIAAFPRCTYRFEVVRAWDFTPVPVSGAEGAA